MVRRSVAAGAGLLALILMVLLVRGCLDSRKESAIVDWVRDVDALMRESNGERDGLFQQLEGDGGASDVEIENALNGFRIESDKLVDRARDLDRPDELADAERYVVETLDFRADGIAQIADELPAALAGGDEQSGAARKIAEAMQAFLASDQIYVRRVLPAVDSVLEQEGLEQSMAESTFLQDLAWLDPAEVASRIGGVGGTGDDEATAGLHGNGLGAVTLGGQTLIADGSTSVALSDGLTLQVQVANQGDSTETDVTVRATIGSGAEAIEAEEVLDTIASGETKTVDVPIDDQPPTGQVVPIDVEIEPVPGEEKTDNNVGEFSVIFTS
jgi:hypothetical protein